MQTHPITNSLDATVVNTSPPTYESAVQTGNQVYHRQDYFDFSLVPEGNVLYPNQVPPINPVRYDEQTNEDGHVKAFDAKLDSDIDALWNYFMQHTDRPRMCINFHGHHKEYRRTTHLRNGRHVTDTSSHNVTDFWFSIDVSAYMNSNWSRMVLLNDGRNPGEWRSVLSKYTSSKKSFKEIHMRKQPLWDFNELTNALGQCIRMTGYSGALEITYPLQNYKVSAYKNTGLSKALETSCCLKCMLFTFIPCFGCYYCSNKTKVDNIVVEFPMLAPGSVFYSKNYFMIQNLCIMRSREVVPAL